MQVIMSSLSHADPMEKQVPPFLSAAYRIREVERAAALTGENDNGQMDENLEPVFTVEMDALMTALQERYDTQSVQLYKLSETNRLQCMEIKELKEVARKLTRREREFQRTEWEFQAAYHRLLKELDVLRGRLCPDGRDIVINREGDVLAAPADGGWEKPLPPIIQQTHSEEEVMDREATLKGSDTLGTHEPVQSIGVVDTGLQLEVAKAEALLDLRHVELNKVEQSIGACKIQYDTLKRKIIKCQELWEFEKHMGGAVTLSMEDAMHRLDYLNLQIVEAASAMVSTMACYKDRQRYLGQDLMATVDKAKKIVGSNTFLSLEGADYTTAIAQIVLQTAMVTWSATLILAWRPGDELANNALQHTYDMICASTGNHWVAGKWRSLARAQPISMRREDLLKDVVLKIQSIFRASGWWNLGCEERPGLEFWLTQVLDAALAMRRATGVYAATIDLDVTVISPGAIFHPSSMENILGDGPTSLGQNEYVVGTTALGLQKRATMTSMRKGVGNVKFLKKPQVVLESAFRKNGFKGISLLPIPPEVLRLSGMLKESPDRSRVVPLVSGSRIGVPPKRNNWT